MTENTQTNPSAHKPISDLIPSTANAFNPQKNTRFGRTLLFIALAIIFFLLGAGAMYYVQDKDIFESGKIKDSPTPTVVNTVEPTSMITVEHSNGYVTGVFVEGGKSYVKFSTVRIVTHSDVDYADFCNATYECPNDYYIDASNSQTLNLELVVNSKFYVLQTLDNDGNCVLTDDDDQGFKRTAVSIDELQSSPCDFIKVGEQGALFYATYYSNNVVIDVGEQYVP